MPLLYLSRLAAMGVRDLSSFKLRSYRYLAGTLIGRRVHGARFTVSLLRFEPEGPCVMSRSSSDRIVQLSMRVVIVLCPVCAPTSLSQEHLGWSSLQRAGVNTMR